MVKNKHMKITIPESLEEMTLEQLIELGDIKDATEQADYVIKEICKVNPDKVHPEDKLPILATINHYMTENKVSSAPLHFETNGRKFSTLKNLLNIKVRHFIELVNSKVDGDSLSNYHLVAACMYREDWSKEFDEDEVIDNAGMFYESSSKFSFWGVEKYSELVSLLQSTYPILYEGKQENKESEGRRAYSMLNGLAKDDPTKWKVAENLELWRAFVWMEEKEIERQNTKQ